MPFPTRNRRKSKPSVLDIAPNESGSEESEASRVDLMREKSLRPMEISKLDRFLGLKEIGGPKKSLNPGRASRESSYSPVAVSNQSAEEVWSESDMSLLRYMEKMYNSSSKHGLSQECTHQQHREHNIQYESSSTYSIESSERDMTSSSFLSSIFVPSNEQVVPPRLPNKPRSLDCRGLDPEEMKNAQKTLMRLLLYKRMGMLVKSEFRDLTGVTRVVRLYEGRCGSPLPAPDTCNMVELKRFGHEGKPWHIISARMPYKLRSPPPPYFRNPSDPALRTWLMKVRALIRAHQIRLHAFETLKMDPKLFTNPEEQFRNIGSVEANIVFEFPVRKEQNLLISSMRFELQVLFSGGQSVVPDSVKLMCKGVEDYPSDSLMKVVNEFWRFFKYYQSPLPLLSPMVQIVRMWNAILKRTALQAQEELKTHMDHTYM